MRILMILISITMILGFASPGMCEASSEVIWQETFSTDPFAAGHWTRSHTDIEWQTYGGVPCLRCETNNRTATYNHSFTTDGYTELTISVRHRTTGDFSGTYIEIWGMKDGSWSHIGNCPAANTTSWVTRHFNLSDGDWTKVRLIWKNGNLWNQRVSNITINGVIACQAPVVVSHPESRTVCEGDSVTFSVTATGAEPLLYQWMKDGQDEVVGATSSSYTIDSVSWADVGSYHCVVTNDCGTVNSDSAVLMVNVAPSITLQPQNASVIEDDSVTFIVEAEGSAPLSYQWRKDGVDIISATSSIYSIDSAQLDDSGSYDCVVTNMCGSVISDAATLSVGPPIFPLGLTNTGIGGGDWYYDPAAKTGQKGVRDGVGLNTTGLLVRTWGIVTYAATDYFYIDDGSNRSAEPGNTGVRVEAPSGVAIPAQDSYVVVTGISSCYKVGEEVYPRILVRKQSDVSLVQ